MPTVNPRSYVLCKELQVIIENMGFAMTRANVAYVKEGRMTPGMEDALKRYYAWAKEAYEEGM